jgi:DNA-binding MarR family transcriptional regulator
MPGKYPATPTNLKGYLYMSEVMPVFRVLRYIRDARSTQKAERALLLALGMRCQPAKKFIAWPSYRQLALDTCLDEVTLKRAAKKLEDANLIKRTIRPNRSNCFYINVPLLQQQAAAVKAAEDAAKGTSGDEGSPFGDPVLTDSSKADFDDQEGGVA